MTKKWIMFNLTGVCGGGETKAGAFCAVVGCGVEWEEE